MAQFKVFEKGMRVNGATIMAVVSGLGSFKSLAEKYLKEADLANVIGDDKHWYSQQAWLDVFQQIALEMGDNTLLSIGKQIPENAVFPKEIDSIEKALASIDIAYHMNHQNASGEVLFDPSRPPPMTMLEGIGHYRYKKGESDAKAVMVCENPYPCAFDRGIIEAMAKRFNKLAKVEHDDGNPCRKKGANSCTYQVAWR